MGGKPDAQVAKKSTMPDEVGVEVGPVGKGKEEGHRIKAYQGVGENGTEQKTAAPQPGSTRVRMSEFHTQ